VDLRLGAAGLARPRASLLDLVNDLEYLLAERIVGDAYVEP
jgi:hypothetical protein